MKKTNLTADARYTIGAISPNLFGSFIEHLGRAVYEGIYEPGHPTADEAGFRGDVIELIKELGVPMVRYPGGNFVSGYNWRDGVGPKENRPTRLELAWFSTETNEFGTDEFMKWCKKAEIAPMMAVNMGTGTVQRAAEPVEYCNHAGGTTISEMRRANGADEPYNVRYWCLGNEMDGLWQIGHLNAEDYGKKAFEAAKLMRWTNGEMGAENGVRAADPLRLVVCGSCNREMETFPEWDRIVLEHTYDMVDYLSMHRYYMYDKTSPRPLEDFLASADDMHGFIKTMRATIEYVRAKLRSPKQVGLSFDEWNIWTINAPRHEPIWKQAPHLLEDVYTFRDAIVFAGLMNTLLNNCDIVKIGCLAQLVNVIAPIMTEKGGGTCRQTSFYPFKYIASARGDAIRIFSDSDTFDSKHGKAHTINAALTYDKETRSAKLSVCNYGEEACELALELNGFGELTPETYIEMTGELDACNTFSDPNAVAPHRRDLPEMDGNRTSLVLPPMSWSFVTFKE